MTFLKVKLGIFSLLAIFAVSVFLTSCEQDAIDIPSVVESEVDQQISEIPTDDAAFPTEMEYDQKLVAKIQKDGHELEFLSVGPPETRSFLIVETLYGEAEENESEAFHTTSENAEEGESVFDIFMKITDSNTQIPEEIALTAKGDQLELSGRTVMDNKHTLEILDSAYTEPSTVESRGCESEDLGWTPFRNRYCWGNYVNSRPTDIRFCDSGKWTNYVRNSYYGGSWRGMRRMYVGLNTVCGYSNVKFYHYIFGKWHLITQYTVGPGKRNFSHYSPAGAPKTCKSIRISRPYNTGYFRASSRFTFH